ncbi:bifunctional adenosylcobinamide kinase/adenosylcobinamide-phosphate guanylyltransferase [Mycobacterium shinjukuense]|uniref:bifunctional adenosylcobinamide kinase/adenosylcobinamide-phosphate guanylyltransferase n=1 Tax=Mycobacterium shinjukuense TaxID=398694 RepID=UPI0009F4BB99|nr:bifunctional adenosylcobinamide kinase/adenosylcobinamide-phosphate guanylyltransferase [Mycobacterium shinjukuense]MCV6984935.1 bifunctional adenosylcobinamide kinase/adenosylcobinamide-phosphate guanylyltransferase [Mycobacterium shinjukuense]ORB70432.1 adenosylcobinamide kinase/adenosylcobinamide phosphate guanyltransferase [Mycobacterium shinjukuense]
MRTLVLGGIRSGKSRWAERAVAASLPPGQPVRYLAAGPASQDDTEWARRVAGHRNRRPGHWLTVETDDIVTQLRESPHTPTLVDDLGAWLTRTLDRHHAWDHGSQDVVIQHTIEDMLDAVGGFAATLVLVSPEVGLTVVPATASGRRFADQLGGLNQRLAALCDRVVLVVAGQAVPIKPASP